MQPGLRTKLLNRSRVFGTTVGYVEWGGMAELYSDPAPDFVVFDLEHGCLSETATENHLRIFRLKGIPTIVRTEDKQYNLISRMLDIGASGVLVPRLDTVEQARDVISSTRFPPRGKKGCGGYSLLKGIDGVEDFNRQKVLIAQIESRLGIRSLGGILDLGEFSGIIVGPTDLSIEMEIPFRYDHPRLIDAIREVMNLCVNRGVSSGLYCNTPADALYWSSHGANILWSGGDIDFIRQGYLRLRSEIEASEKDGAP
jgi:2-keto-3-deoxy-L-rhamnonate aldolase RhmA